MRPRVCEFAKKPSQEGCHAGLLLLEPGAFLPEFLTALKSCYRLLSRRV